jgi:hypothetical protein
VARKRYEVDLLAPGQVDNRAHDGTEGHVHVRLYAFLLEARLKPFQVPASTLVDEVHYFWVQRRNRLGHIYRFGHGLYNLQQDNL